MKLMFGATKIERTLLYDGAESLVLDSPATTASAILKNYYSRIQTRIQLNE